MNRALPLLALAAVGCVTVPHGTASTPAIHLVDGHCGPEVETLAEDLLSKDLAPDAFAKQLDGVLAANPDCGAAHLWAGYWAELGADDDAAWEHFLRAAADRKNPQAALALREWAHLDSTGDQHHALVELFGELAANHPDPLVRALASNDLVYVLSADGDMEGAKHASEPLGMARDLLIAGPFENEEGKGFATPYPPEQGIDLNAEMPGKLRLVHWRKVSDTERDGAVSPGEFVSPSQQVVAYLVTWVHADADGLAQVRFTSGAPIAAWLNDAPLVSDPHVRAGAIDNVIGQGTLHAGWNKLLVKSAVRKERWYVGVRFTDTHGQALSGLTYSRGPQQTPKGTPLAPPTEDAPTSLAGRFLAAREASLTGHAAAAGQRFSALQAEHPASTMIRFHAAAAAYADDKVERSLGLLTESIEHQPKPFPGFLLARAHIYEHKDLKDQAQRDIEAALAAQPGSRMGVLQLSQLLRARGWQHDREARLRAALARWPDSDVILEELAATREELGFRSEGMALRRQVVAMLPGHVADMRVLRDDALRREDFDEARDDAARLAVLAPGSVEDQLVRAEIERLAGNPDGADKILAALQEQQPDSARVLVRRSNLAEARGDKVQAIALLEKARERDPNDAWVTERLDHLNPPQADALTPYEITDEALESLLAQTPASTKDPAAQVEAILEDTVTLVNADGSTKVMHTEIARALNQQGRDALVHFTLAGKSQNRVLKAFAISPGGERTEASSVKPTEVRFRSLEVGSIVVLQYLSYGHRGEGVADGQYFQWENFAYLNWHIDRIRWLVLTEHGRQVAVESPAVVRADTAQAGNWDVRTFSRNDVPAVPAEPNMPPYGDVLPRVRLSTFPGWDNFVSWEKALLLESFPEDPKLDALAKKLTEGAKTPQEKLDRLFRYVSQEIRYQQEYETIIAGWQPHPSAVVLERKYGDCKDKATLLIALARSAGLNLEFTVLGTHALGHPDRKTPFPDFDHAIVYVPKQDGFEKSFFVDPTVDALDLGNLREDDQGSQGLVLDPKTGNWSFVEIPYQSADFQHEAHRIDLDIQGPQQASATDEITLRGSAASAVRVMLRNEHRAQQLYAFVTNHYFPRATLVHGEAPDHEDFSHPLTLKMQVDASNTLQPEGDHFRFKLPSTFPLADLVSLDKRESSMDLRAPASESTDVHARVPEGMQLIDPPPETDLKSACFHVKRTVKVAGRELTVHDEFERSCVVVPASDYAAFRADVQKATARLDQAIIFGPATVKNTKTAKR